MNMRKILSGAMALLLAASMPVGALAQTYDLAEGSITVEAKADGNQYVSQDGGVQDEIQTAETVITQNKGASSTTTNTITIKAEENATAEVTISDVDIDVSNTGDSANNIPGEVAISTGGDGNVTIELGGENTLKSGDWHAGLEKSNGGNLTIGDKDDNGSLVAVGGTLGAGIGGGYDGSASDITITGGDVTAIGGIYGAGIGGGNAGDGTNITIEGGNVKASGGNCGAGIGGGYFGDGFDIAITGGNVEATGDNMGAGIGGSLFCDGTNITVSGDAQVKVSGGRIASDIGGGDSGNGEITPDTSKLGDNGSISYFAPDADKTTTNPERLLHKTNAGNVETHKNISIKSKTDPTCTKPGSITYLCSCGEEVVQEIPAIPHSFTTYVSQNDATCEKDETKVAECDYGCGTKRTMPIAGTKLEHIIAKYPAKEATCTEIGWKAYEKCSRPGCTYTTYSEEKINPDNHALKHYDAKTPTCTEKGWKEYDACTRCNYSTYVEVPIDSSNHDLKHHDAKEATCTEKGWKEYDTCTRCNYSTYVEVPIDSSNHDLKHHDAKEATCTEKGWKEYDACTRCDYSTYQELDKLDHSFTDYVSNGDASYEADGTETAQCDNGCGATDTRTEVGSHLPIYRVTDETGREIASSRSESGSVLTITVNQESATISGTTAGLRVLQARGITTIVFVTASATSTFNISDLLTGTSYRLTHSGTAVGFTLDGTDILKLLK